MFSGSYVFQGKRDTRKLTLIEYLPVLPHLILRKTLRWQLYLDKYTIIFRTRKKTPIKKAKLQQILI